VNSEVRQFAAPLPEQRELAYLKAYIRETPSEKGLSMKRFLLMTTCFAVLRVTVVAQDDNAEYHGWMKSAGATAGSLRKNLEAKNADAAAADAKKLQEIFGHVHSYWSDKHIDDATKFAMDAGTGFGEVAKQAAAGKFEDASATLKTTSANCGGCHTAHREKSADGTWKIK
jgi:cytochrome c556